MYQTDRGSYRKEESMFKQFRHSCLGRLVIALVVVLILLLIAWLTNPSAKRMRTEMMDNIRQSLEADGPTDEDAIDVFVDNIGYTFSSASGEEIEELRKLFDENNTLEFHDWGILSYMTVLNHPTVTQETCGIGIFGMVIPTANFKRFLPKEQPRGEYNKPLYQPNVENEEYFGTTNVDVFHYEGE